MVEKDENDFIIMKNTKTSEFTFWKLLQIIENAIQNQALKSQLRVGSDKNQDFHDYSMDFVLIIPWILEANAAKGLSGDVRNGT